MFFCWQLHVLLISGSGGGGGIVSLYRCSYDPFVMVVDYLFLVVHAAVTILMVFQLKIFLNLFGKVLIYKGEEFVSYVGTGVLAKRRNVVPLLIFLFACFGWFAL